MKLGLFMMPLHPPEKSRTQGFDEDIEVVVRAEEMGFTEVWVGQHHTLAWEPLPSNDIFGIHNRALKPLYVPIDEEHPLWPHESYSLSKHFGERMAESYAAAYGIEAISLRYNWVWVERWREKAARLVADNRAGIFDPATAWLGGYISVRDVARGCLAAANYHFPAQQAIPYAAFFLTAANTSYALPTLDLLRAIYGEAPPQKDPDYFAADPYATVFDIRKAERRLGWTPQDRWQTFAGWEL